MWIRTIRTAATFCIPEPEATAMSGLWGPRGPRGPRKCTRCFRHGVVTPFSMKHNRHECKFRTCTCGMCLHLLRKEEILKSNLRRDATTGTPSGRRPSVTPVRDAENLIVVPVVTVDGENSNLPPQGNLEAGASDLANDTNMCTEFLVTERVKRQKCILCSKHGARGHFRGSVCPYRDCACCARCRMALGKRRWKDAHKVLPDQQTNQAKQAQRREDSLQRTVQYKKKLCAINMKAKERREEQQEQNPQHDCQLEQPVNETIRLLTTHLARRQAELVLTGAAAPAGVPESAYSASDECGFSTAALSAATINSHAEGNADGTGSTHSYLSQPQLHALVAALRQGGGESQVDARRPSVEILEDACFTDEDAGNGESSPPRDPLAGTDSSPLDVCFAQDPAQDPDQGPDQDPAQDPAQDSDVEYSDAEDETVEDILLGPMLSYMRDNSGPPLRVGCPACGSLFDSEVQLQTHMDATHLQVVPLTRLMRLFKLLLGSWA